MGRRGLPRRSSAVGLSDAGPGVREYRRDSGERQRSNVLYRLDRTVRRLTKPPSAIQFDATCSCGDITIGPRGKGGPGYVLRVIEPAHRMFRTPDRGAHVHVWREGSEGQVDQLLFRDWLRTHDDDRGRYEAVKRELAAREWESMGDYADAKSDVVAGIMRRAGGG